MKTLSVVCLILFVSLVVLFGTLASLRACICGCMPLYPSGKSQGYCASDGTWTYFGAAAAIDNFYDNGSDPFEIAENTLTMMEVDRTGCDHCPCSQNGCENPCFGQPVGGDTQAGYDVSMTTDCVDPGT